MEFSAILESVNVSPPEFAVMWHVADTLVVARNVLAEHTAQTLPNCVSVDISVEDCLHAIDSLIRRGLLIELTAADIEADLARWKAEPLPVSWGVDLRRSPGDVDFTAAGFHLQADIRRRQFPTSPRRIADGADDSVPDVIRFFGETEESCHRMADSMIPRLNDALWNRLWPSIHVDAMRPLGPWWHSRFELIPTGFEIVVRNIAIPTVRP